MVFMYAPEMPKLIFLQCLHETKQWRGGPQPPEWHSPASTPLTVVRADTEHQISDL